MSKQIVYPYCRLGKLICLVVWRIKEELEVVAVVKWWENEAEDVDAFKEFDANNLRAFRVKCLQHAKPGQAC